MWLRTDTTLEAITKDLEEMHAKGIEGAILYDSGVGGAMKAWARMELRGKNYEVVKTRDFPDARITQIPGDPLETWTSRSRELFRHAAKEAGRLGVKLCLTVGLAGTSGPIEPEYGQQKLMWSEAAVAGPKNFDATLPAPATDVPATLGPASLLSPGGGPVVPHQHATSTPRKGNTRFIGNEVAVLAVPDNAEFAVADVVDLPAKMDAAGRLRWHAPAGAWKILRFGYAPTGAKNAWGLYTDAMSAEALNKTWNATIGQMLKEMSPAERKGLFAVEGDSWEAGTSTWTKRLPAEFQKRRGYDLLPWLPALAGKNIAGADGARRDYYRTIADLIAQNHYGRLRELANRHGLLAFSEAAGPNSGQLDGMQNGGSVDVAMGEVWIPSIHRPTPARRFMLRNAASASHIYGKRIIPCEAFTSIGPFWEETFFDLKNVADQAFCDGCNLIAFHNYSHSPSLAARPGYAYFAGTHYNRNVTWWEQTPAFNAYVGRCSYMLQQGLFVADALYFRGDALGQVEQRKTKPALPAEGYDHDNCNLDALLNRLGVKEGRIVLPDGMSYRALVLPEGTTLRPEAAAKVAALEKAGAIVIKDGSPASTLGVPPDFEYTGLSDAGELDWIHRRAGDVDIYFVASRWDAKEKVTCTFRVAGKQPELWNPVTGEMRDAAAFRQQGGRTTLPLEFNPRESVFVVFRRPIAGNGTAASNYPPIRPVAEIAGAWEVAFDPKWGGPTHITFENLTDWTKRPESGVRYYSGTAVYRKRFPLAASSGRLWLNLGVVREIASVRLNGVDLGLVWTKPARVDLKSAARPGENDLEITVVNLWPNRLIGDASLPREKRLTETNIHKFSAVTPLCPSGLLGPVTIESEQSVVHTGQKVAFLGDSITAQGWSNPHGYVRLVVAGMEANGVTIVPIPAGVGGHRSSDMLARLQRDVLDKEPDWVAVSCGMNDVIHGAKGVPLGDYRKNMAAIIDRCQQAGIKVLVLTTTLAGKWDSDASRTLGEYSDALRSVATARKCLIADLYPVFVEAAKAADPLHALTGDGMHMTPEGNLLMARTVLNALGFSESQIAKAHQTWLDLPHTGDLSARVDIVLNKQFFRTTCDLTLREREKILNAAKAAHRPTLMHWSKELLASLMKKKVKPAGPYDSLDAIFDQKKDKQVQEELQQEFEQAIRAIVAGQ